MDIEDLDIQFYIYGTPQGEKTWGCGEDSNYISQFYNNTESEDKFWVETRDLKGVRYYYYSYLKYNIADGASHRAGAYLGMTIRIDKYCIDAIGLYQILDVIYKNCLMGLIIDRDSPKFLITDFQIVNKDLNKISDLMMRLFRIFYSSSLSYKKLQLPEKKQPYRINLVDCTNDRIEHILLQYGAVKISPCYETVNDRKKNREYREKINSLEESKRAEIDCLTTSLNNAKRNYDDLLKIKEQLEKEKREQQLTIGRLNEKEENYQKTLSKEIKKIWTSAITTFWEQNVKSKYIADDKFKTKGYERIIGIAKLVLIVIIACLCSILVCNDLGVLYYKKGAGNNTAKITELQEEKKRLESINNELEEKYDNLQKENKVLKKQLAEKNNPTQQQQVIPRIDVKEFSKGNNSFEIGKVYTISIKNLTETKGGKWKVVNAKIIEWDEKGCKIQINKGDSVFIKYLKDGVDVTKRSAKIKGDK